MDTTYNFTPSDIMTIRTIARDLCGEATGNYDAPNYVLERDGWMDKAETVLDEMREE